MPTTNNQNRRTKRINFSPKYCYGIESVNIPDHTVNIPVQSDFNLGYSHYSFESNAFLFFKN